MNKMKRSVAFIAVVVGMMLAGGASQAASSLSMIWKNNGLNTITGQVNSDTVTAIIVLVGDSSTGVSGVELNFTYNTAELDYVSSVEHSGKAAKVGMGNQFSPLNSSNTVADDVAGTITGFDSATLAAGCLGCTITLGSITFHVTGELESSVPNDVVISPTSAVADTFNNVTVADLNAAELGGPPVPEPTTALLVVGGLLGLGYAGRRSVR